ncbi:MAG TPA: thioredoxin domain-containing protein [Solirubrobacteraceae bacterium]|jgi:protein-disulfide isomerase
MSSRTAEKAKAREARLAAEQAEAQRATRGRRLKLLGLVLALAAVLVAAGILVSRSGSDDEKEATAQPETLFAGIPQDGAWLGDPQAPVVVEEYADLQCPFCARFATGELPGIVSDYVRPGKVRIRLRLLTFLGDDSVTAGRFAVAAGQQDRLWPFVEAFYAQQGRENSGYVTADFLRARAKEVPDLDADQAFTAADGAPVTKQLDANQQAAQAAKVDATPTFLVGRRGGPLAPVDGGDLRGALDAALAGQ